MDADKILINVNRGIEIIKIAGEHKTSSKRKIRKNKCRKTVSITLNVLTNSFRFNFFSLQAGIWHKLRVMLIY